MRSSATWSKRSRPSCDPLPEGELHARNQAYDIARIVMACITMLTPGDIGLMLSCCRCVIAATATVCDDAMLLKLTGSGAIEPDFGGGGRNTSGAT